MTPRITMESAETGARRSAATSAEISRLLGEPEQHVIAEILALRPTSAEVEEAVARVQGDGDVPGRQGHALAGKVARIFEIVRADYEQRAAGPDER